MKRFDKILEDIRSVKIQGAENVARAGVNAYLLNQTKESAKRILGTRPTEPLLQNSINLLTQSKNPKLIAKKIIQRIKKYHELMANYGSRLIKDDMNIYTHCHSSSVIDILRKAKKNGKRFVVYTTEVEPLLQGRKTAEEMAKVGIKVIIAPDLAADKLMSRCDLFLFGADAFTKNFLVNKIGTATLCDLARHHKIPRYSCGISLKYSKKVKMEERKGGEVWSNHEKNIKIENPAFDKVSYDLVNGIVCEGGILSSREFLKRVKEKIKNL
jgi:translation initiation factor 2B subunit (eIF-2B alpha/beta/delta family)